MRRAAPIGLGSSVRMRGGAVMLALPPYRVIRRLSRSSALYNKKTWESGYKELDTCDIDMLRSYPDESSPSHQNWELKRQ